LRTECELIESGKMKKTRKEKRRRRNSSSFYSYLGFWRLLLVRSRFSVLNLVKLVIQFWPLASPPGPYSGVQITTRLQK